MRSIERMWYSQEAPLWLVPLSLLYGLVMTVRGLFYRLGLRHRIRVGAPVVVIGNLTVGGTGRRRWSPGCPRISPPAACASPSSRAVTAARRAGSRA